MKQKNDTSNLKFRISISAFSFLFYLASLTQNAYIFSNYEGEKTQRAFELILMGAFAVLGGGLLEWVVWLANPFYILALFLFLKNDKKASLWSFFAAILSISFLFWNNILVSESGKTGPIESLELGYWLWVSSISIFSLGVLIFNYFESRKSPI